MSICSDDLMVLADELMITEQEVGVRSAISRSYYALLHEAKDMALAMNLPAGTGSGSHEKVITRYLASGGRLSYVGREIRKRKLMRNFADYDILLPMDGIEAAMHVKSCKALIGDLRRITVRAEA